MSPARGGPDYLNKLDSAWITRSMGVTPIASLDPNPARSLLAGCQGPAHLLARINPTAPRRSEECNPYSFKAPTSTSQHRMSLMRAYDLGIPVRCAPAGTRPPAARTWSAASARHGTTAASTYSSKPSKDQILGRLGIDNSGRPDEACVGDLVTLEASRAGVWHRDLGLAPRHDRTSNHTAACIQLWEHCLPSPNALIHRTRLLSLRPPAASTSSPPTTSWWETTTESCSCRRSRGRCCGSSGQHS